MVPSTRESWSCPQEPSRTSSLEQRPLWFGGSTHRTVLLIYDPATQWTSQGQSVGPSCPKKASVSTGGMKKQMNGSLHLSLGAAVTTVGLTTRTSKTYSSQLRSPKCQHSAQLPTAEEGEACPEPFRKHDLCMVLEETRKGWETTLWDRLADI